MSNFVVSKPSKLSISRLESLYNKHGTNIYSLCLRMLTNQKPAEDATVDTFVRFWRSANAGWDEHYSVSRLRELAIKACRKKVQGR
jgi:DNA-directed RNA polymerase specialized sigma24 family protein